MDQAGHTQLYGGGSLALTVDTNQNVGINQSSPAGTFHVVAKAGTTGLMTVGAASNNIAHFYTSASATALVVDSGGKVGIGTTTPATKLDVRQSADDNGLRIYGYDDVASRYAELFVNSSGYTVLDASTDRGLVLKGHAIDFYVNSGGTHIGRWTYDGKLGVGTTAPTSKLRT